MKKRAPGGPRLQRRSARKGMFALHNLQFISHRLLSPLVLRRRRSQRGIVDVLILDDPPVVSGMRDYVNLHEIDLACANLTR